MACRFLLLLLLIGQVVRPGQAGAATEIPFRLVHGLIWLSLASPNQAEPLQFVLDTGAGTSVLHAATAQRLGVAPAGRMISVQGVQGTVSAGRTGDFQAWLGAERVPRRMLMLNLRAVSALCHQQMDGLLGADFLKGRILQIDFHRQVLRLLAPAEVETAGTTTLPLAWRGDALCTKVQVAAEQPAWARVDTGCNAALRWAQNGAWAKLKRPTLGLALNGGATVNLDVHLGDLHFAQVATHVQARPIFPGEAGLLGTGLLARCVATLDVPGHRLLLKRY